MYYTYVLLSEADRRLYIGATQDLRAGSSGTQLVGSDPLRTDGPSSSSTTKLA